MFITKERHNKEMEALKKRLDVAEQYATLYEQMEQHHAATMNRLAFYKSLAGELSIEDALMRSTNLEFGLRIIQKQLLDQMIYASGEDTSICTTQKFESIDNLCGYLYAFINTMLELPAKKED